MIITRREHREYNHSNLYYLRSRIIPLTTIAVRALIRKSQQAYMKYMKKEIEIESNNKKSLRLNNQINVKSATIEIDIYEF